MTPPTEKTRQFAGQLNPFAGHKISLTVAHSAYRCCHGACEAPGKMKAPGLVYINDLPRAIKNSTASMYADDTSLCFKSRIYPGK